jgi:hypothetical protein
MLSKRVSLENENEMNKFMKKLGYKHKSNRIITQRDQTNLGLDDLENDQKGEVLSVSEIKVCESKQKEITTRKQFVEDFNVQILQCSYKKNVDKMCSSAKIAPLHKKNIFEEISKARQVNPFSTTVNEDSQKLNITISLSPWEESQYSLEENTYSLQNISLSHSSSSSLENNSFAHFKDLIADPHKGEQNEEEYKKFGLILNTDISLTTPFNKFLPKKLKNDDVYKQKLISYLRKPTHSDNKTDTCKFVRYRKFSDLYGTYKIFKLDGNVTKFCNIFNMKRRKISSEKKIYEAELPFEPNTLSEKISGCPNQYFKFYWDRDIGFSKTWQRPIKSSEMDDDVETDTDQLSTAGRHVFKEIGEGIKVYSKNPKNVRNITLLKDFKIEY